MARHKPPEYKQRGYLLPETLEPANYRCVCVPVPADAGHIRAFLGQLDELGHWWNWERDEARGGTVAAHVWRRVVEFVRDNIDCAEEVRGVSGCCCGSQTNVQQRFNPDTGVLEVSYDGGQTWETAPPEQDPRNAIVVFPDTLPDGDDPAKKCAAANSIVKLYQNQEQQEYDELAGDAQRADLVAIILGILMLLGILATGGLLNILSLAIAVLVANYDAATYAAFFTETFWQDLLCACYCHVANDGSFTQEDFHRVVTDMSMKYPINAMPGKWIYNYLQLAGAGGLSNASQLGLDAGLSCDDCNCAPCTSSDIDPYNPATVDNPITVVDEQTFDVEGVDYSGSYRIMICTSGFTYAHDGNATNVQHPAQCYLSYEALTGNVNISNASHDMKSFDERAAFFPSGNFVWMVELLSTAPFTVRFTIG